MHKLIPNFIQEQFSQGNSHGDLIAAALFIDISGFSTMMDELMKHGPHGAEVMADVMRSVFEPLAHSVHSQGGFVATLAGDAFTALFPLDLGESNSCARAIAAAWEMQSIITKRAEHRTPYGDFPIRVKIGLAVGDTSWGIISSENGKRAAYYFQGDSIEQCAEAEHHAQAGEILVTENCLAHLNSIVHSEPVGNHYRITGLVGEIPTALPIIPTIPDLEVMALFYPKTLLTQERSGEFRQVVNLFISLPTVRNDTQLTIFMQSLFDLQDQYGGLLGRLDFGDKGTHLLLFWGVPIAYENDIERVLNFLLDLQMHTSIPINAGMTYQIAHAGFIGSSYLEEYTCYGRGVNLAARFMASAPRGEIWVDNPVYQRAKAHFDLEYEGDLSFKGFSEKQSVYLLHERKEQPEPLYAGVLVGREAELEQLTAFIQPLRQGAYAGTLVVLGEAGVGKSRLVYELQVNSANSLGQSLWAICQTDEILRQPLNPFRYWLQRYFDQSPTQSESRNKRNFNRKLDELIASLHPPAIDLVDELDRTRSFLGALMDLQWPDSLYEQLDPQGRYENTLIAISILLRAESLRQPIILLLEDIQWLDPDSRACLLHLDRAVTCDECRTYPIAVIATARPEEGGPLLGDEIYCQKIILKGISHSNLVILAENYLQGPVSPDLIELLSHRAEGNPFFAEQILRYLDEQGLLNLMGDHWSINSTWMQAPLPTDVRSVLVARLDRLAKSVKDTVQTASVLGREFEIKILAHMLKDDDSLFEEIESATQAGIWNALDDLRYLFKHLLLREAAYRMLVRAQRKSLHALASQAIQSLYATDLQPHYGALAYHGEQGGLIDQARHYLQLAGEIASNNYQNHQAVDYFTRALNLTPEEDYQARFTLLLAREDMNRLTGDQQARQFDLDELMGLAMKLDGTTDIQDGRFCITEVLERRARFDNDAGNYTNTQADAQLAVTLALRLNNPQLAIDSYLSLSMALFRQADYAKAIEHALQGLELARQIGDLRGQSHTLNTLGLIALEQNEHQKAQEYLLHSLKIAGEVNDWRIQAMAQNNLGNLAGAMGDFIAAQEYYLSTLQITRQIGDRSHEGLVLGNLGWVTGILGDYAAARAYCEQNQRLARETGNRPGETFALINLSAFCGRQGECATALTYAEQALHLARQMSSPYAEAWALTYSGHAYAEAGQHQSANQAYQAAIEIWRSINQPTLSCEPHAGLARLALMLGDLHTAREHVEVIQSHLEGGGTLDGTDESLRVYLTCYQVLDATGDPRAQDMLITAYQSLQEQASRISNPELRYSFLENVPYNREILAAWTK